MQTKIVLAALAGTALASNVQNLQARQTADACLSIVQTIPTPPPAVQSALVQNAHTNLCSFSVPSSLSKDWASYTSAQSSWYKANQNELTKCSMFSQYKTKVPLDCKAGDSATKTSDSGASNTSGGAGAAKTNGAAREGGMAAAAVAAAGFALAAL
ncbi:hypothetical protein QQS21_000755 [Conoideocrella luteorostrata]|uniref:Infection structure specific protein n=1 Tax=Conoideocrella luteorostrata TaxID=1105319 RepID=A0AAJ0CYB2_9HYPO|nr:hypothetical protein QQS21_000755 [Conoideocrella luteorostrata]